MALTSATLIILLLYVLKLWQFKCNWEKYPAFISTSEGAVTGITVIVAVRNEISNLEALLSSLKKQEYPAAYYEIILVNDHSDDGSEALIRDFCEKNPNFSLINNEREISGKKSAIMKGINSAAYELIVTTDADCTMDKYWLATIARFYREKNPDMIIGLVDMVAGTSFFEKFQEVEFLSLIASGAAAAAGYKSIYCNAACFAFKRSLYQSMQDPLQQLIASGDDTLFMHAAKKHRKRILLLKSVTAIVVTQGLSSWSAYYNQRRRWVSKSRYYRDPDILYAAFLVLLANLGFIFSLVTFASFRNTWLFPVFYIVKSFTDFLFLKSFLHFYCKKLPLLQFMAFALIYPFFAVFFASAGLLGSYSWKGRSYSPVK